MIDRFLHNYNLRRCDNLFPSRKTATYSNLSLGQESQIDYIVTSSPGDIADYQVLDPAINFSDHFPLIINLNFQIDRSTFKSLHSNTGKKFQMQLRWDKADLNSYYNHTGNSLAPFLNKIDTLLSNFDTCNYDKQKYSDCIETLYGDIVALLNNSAKLYVPERSKAFFKFWWNEELNSLKEASINSDRLWKTAGKPRSGPLYQQRQSSRLQYRKRLREEQKSESMVYTNDLHEALLDKKGNEFWKCWRSKFEHYSGCKEVDGSTDSNTIVNKFAHYFSTTYSCNNPNRAYSLQQEFETVRANYCGFPINEELSFDTELVSKTINNLKRGKAPDIEGLTAEHLLCSHPALSVFLSRFFQLILLTSYIPSGFKVSYVVPIPKLKDFRSKALKCDDFRGIAISPLLSKIFEYCFLEKYESYFKSSDNQFGFKKGMGCRNAIYTVRNIVSDYVSKGNTVNLCAIDLSKAFDKVNHNALYIKMMKRFIPVPLLDLIINLFSDCFSCVKWDNAFSNFFRIIFGVRQGSVLSPILFALYIDDISNSVSFFPGCHIILYADDIILISPSVLMLQHLLHACEIELNNIDMAINFRKSSCLRIGPRYDATCACITSLDGSIISWATETRYLGIYIVSSRVFKCSLHHAKCGFYRAANAIFGKVGRISSEEVVLQLVKSKCLPVLLYCLEVCPLTKTDLKSLDFVINRFFMKLFRTSNIDTVKTCQLQFSFDLPSVIIEKRAKKFKDSLTKVKYSYTNHV